MNCLYLLLLLFCCSRSNGRCAQGGGCGGETPCRRNTPQDCPVPRSGGPGRGERPGSCADMRNMGQVHEEIRRGGQERETGCPCQDLRPDPPRPEPGPWPGPDQPLPRPFPPFADGPDCGCDEN